LEKLVSRTKRNQRKVLQSVCRAAGAWSLYRVRCAAQSLYGCDAQTSTDCLHLRGADPCVEVWLPVCCARSLYWMQYVDLYGLVAFALYAAWSLYWMRYADLYGLVAFALYAAWSLYGMRCADLCGLVAFAWSLYRMRCTELTGCDMCCDAWSLH